MKKLMMAGTHDRELLITGSQFAGRFQLFAFDGASWSRAAAGRRRVFRLRRAALCCVKRFG